MKDLLNQFLKSILEATSPSPVPSKAPAPAGLWSSLYGKHYYDKALTIYAGRVSGDEWIPAEDEPEESPETSEPEIKQARLTPGDIKPSVTPAGQKKRPAATKSPIDAAKERAKQDPKTNTLFGYIAKLPSRISRRVALGVFELTIESRLPADQKKQAKKLVSKLKELLEAHSNGDTKTARSLVKELHDEFKFYSNAAGTAFKTKAFGTGERHFVGKSSVLARDLVGIFDKYRPKGAPSIVEAEDQDGAAKQELTSASKARQGEYKTVIRKGETVKVFVPDAVSAVNSPRVKNILNGISIADKFKALYGPKDETGDLVDNTGGKNSREYFRHSLERTVSLAETASALEKHGLPKMAQSIRDHTQRMEDILENWDSYTSEERELAVQQSYSDMAVRLHNAEHGGDSEMCGAIMKNLAEMSLYDSELAGDKEVYLPASGSFPAADKLIRIGAGTKAEHIDKISVKFGKNGKVYGMPAQSSTIGLMHPDSFYHEVTSGRVGMEGSETGVRSDALEKTGWARLIKDSGYNQCFTSKAASDRIRKSFENAQQVIATERTKIKPQPPTNKTLALMMKNNKRIEEARRNIAEELSAGIDQSKLEEHGGPERVAMLRNPMAFASMMAMDASIVSGEGFPDLLHAHMVMVDGDGDGAAEEMKTVVEPGTTRLRDWHYLWRETDERGGGLLVGFASSDEDEVDKDITPPKTSKKVKR